MAEQQSVTGTNNANVDSKTESKGIENEGEEASQSKPNKLISLGKFVFVSPEGKIRKKIAAAAFIGVLLSPYLASTLKTSLFPSISSAKSNHKTAEVAQENFKVATQQLAVTNTVAKVNQELLKESREQTKLERRRVELQEKENELQQRENELEQQQLKVFEKIRFQLEKEKMPSRSN